MTCWIVCNYSYYGSTKPSNIFTKVSMTHRLRTPHLHQNEWPAVTTQIQRRNTPPYTTMLFIAVDLNAFKLWWCHSQTINSIDRLNSQPNGGCSNEKWREKVFSSWEHYTCHGQHIISSVWLYNILWRDCDLLFRLSHALVDTCFRHILFLSISILFRCQRNCVELLLRNLQN